MRALALPFSLALAFAVPAAAQAAHFIKVDVVEKGLKAHHHHGHEEGGPTEVHIRMPLSLAKGVLETVADQEIHINGTIDVEGSPKKMDKVQKFKVDQLVKLLESAKPGDMLLEVTTNTGDLVKITIE